MIELVSASPKK